VMLVLFLSPLTTLLPGGPNRLMEPTLLIALNVAHPPVRLPTARKVPKAKCANL